MSHRKKYIAAVIITLIIAMLSACANQNTSLPTSSQITSSSFEIIQEGDSDFSDMQKLSSLTGQANSAKKAKPTKTPAAAKSKNTKAQKLNIMIGEQNFSIALLDNEAAKALIKMMPLSLNMGDLNANEKYYFFNDKLPTDAKRPDKINNGDLMLYGSNCLVLFYEDFSSSYSYTKLGTIENADGLKKALGKGDVTVEFSIE